MFEILRVMLLALFWLFVAANVVFLGMWLVIYASMWPNPISYYLTADPLLGARHGLTPLPLCGGTAWAKAPVNSGRHFVVMVHGRSGNYAQNMPLALELIKAGHGVLLFDMPRSGFWPLHSEKREDWKTWGKMVDDDNARRAIRLAVEVARYFYPYSPIALYGHSLGGVYALQTALDPRHEIDVVITDGSPFSLTRAALSKIIPVSLIERVAPDHCARPIAETAPGYRGLLEPPHRELHAFSFRTYKHNTSKPYWLGLHSSDDWVVPVSHLGELHERTLGAWRASKQQVIGGPHWAPTRPDRVQAILDALATKKRAEGCVTQ